MKIKFIRPASPLGLAYSDPMEVTMPKAQAKEMVELGYAVELEEGDTDIPESFPGRKILEGNGFRSVAELKRIATVEALCEIDGIGKKMAENIINALNELK